MSRNFFHFDGIKTLRRAILRKGDESHFNAVSQEHALGCAVACVAARCALSYQAALALFERPENAWTVGYDCVDVVAALERAGFDYEFSECMPNRDDASTAPQGTIVFTEPGPAYPAGHYLIRSNQGWMNSWRNFPSMIPVQAGFQAALPGKPLYLIRERA